MTITASGRSVLILAAGLWLCVAGPMRATESDARPADSSTNAGSATDKPIALDKFAKPRHPRKAAKSTNKSAKSDKAAKAAATTSAEADAKTSTEPMPPAVANANAQLPADAPAETTRSVSAKADSVFKGIGGAADITESPANASTEMVAADQLNELDRAISDDKAQEKAQDTANAKPALTLASATIDAPVVVSQSNSATLDQTSLIGKIFIAFGGLLTLASAARMFIA